MLTAPKHAGSIHALREWQGEDGLDGHEDGRNIACVQIQQIPLGIHPR